MAKTQALRDRLKDLPSLTWGRTRVGATLLCLLCVTYIRFSQLRAMSSTMAVACGSHPGLPQLNIIRLSMDRVHRTPQCVLQKIKCITDPMRHAQEMRVSRK